MFFLKKQEKDRFGSNSVFNCGKCGLCWVQISLDALSMLNTLALNETTKIIKYMTDEEDSDTK